MRPFLLWESGKQIHKSENVRYTISEKLVKETEVEVWGMIVLAELLSKNQHEYRYAFGPDKQHMDGILYINADDFNASKVERSCEGMDDSWGFRAMIKICVIINNKKEAPKSILYCPGY